MTTAKTETTNRDERDEYLSTREAAEYLGIHRNAMARLAEREGIQVYVWPFDYRKLVYRKADLDAITAQPIVER